MCQSRLTLGRNQVSLMPDPGLLLSHCPATLMFTAHLPLWGTKGSSQPHSWFYFPLGSPVSKPVPGANKWLSLPGQPPPAPTAFRLGSHPVWLLPWSWKGAGLDRGISSHLRVASRREGKKGGESESEGEPGSPCEEAQTGKEISR